MPLSWTAAAKVAALAAQTDAAFWFLLEISHETFPEPYRFVNNTEVVHRLGFDWNPAFFEGTLPEEGPSGATQTKLMIENIDRSLLDALRPLETPLNVNVYVATSADEDAIVGPYEFTWREHQFDATAIIGGLQGDDILNSRWPRHEFTPSYFRGLFS
ncbi:MAG: DUF1833 family protein [bacterium]